MATEKSEIEKMVELANIAKAFGNYCYETRLAVKDVLPLFEALARNQRASKLMEPLNKAIEGFKSIADASRPIKRDV